MTALQGELHRWYENCEMRTIVLSDDAGNGTVDPLWFPGGHQLQREGEQLNEVKWTLKSCTSRHHIEACKIQVTAQTLDNAC